MLIKQKIIKQNFRCIKSIFSTVLFFFLYFKRNRKRSFEHSKSKAVKKENDGS